jgi:hypothetical protein
MELKHVQSLALDFKFYISQIFNILVKSIVHVNHKSHVYQPTIIRCVSHQGPKSFEIQLWMLLF